MRGVRRRGQLLPEQVWDAPDIPERELFTGQRHRFGAAAGLGTRRVSQAVPVDSRRPRLRSAAADRRALPRSDDVGPFAVWRFNNKIRTMPAGTVLRIETLAPATVHWASMAGRGVQDVEAVDTGLGVWVADLDTTARR